MHWPNLISAISPHYSENITHHLATVKPLVITHIQTPDILSSYQPIFTSPENDLTVLAPPESLLPVMPRLDEL